MYRRILLAIDGDRLSLPALPGLAALARRWSASVHAVLMRPPRGGGHVDDGRREVAEVVESLRSEGVSATGEVRCVDGGSLANALAGVTAYASADVAAIVARDRCAMASALGERTGHELAALELPVLVLPSSPGLPPAEPFAVVAGVRDRFDGPAVTRAALDIAGGQAAHVRLVHVAGPGRSPAELYQAHRMIARTLVGIGGHRRLSTSSTVLTGRGSVAEQLAEEGRRMGDPPIVLGSRRPSTLDALIHGSVAFDLARLGRAPILLARRPVAELVIN